MTQDRIFFLFSIVFIISCAENQSLNPADSSTFYQEVQDSPDIQHNEHHADIQLEEDPYDICPHPEDFQNAEVLPFQANITDPRGHNHYIGSFIDQAIKLRGKTVISSSFINKILDSKGSLKILARGRDSKVLSIDNFSGHLFLCGVDVESITNSNGNITLIGGEIKIIDGFVGNLNLIDAKVSETHNFTGVIK